MERVSDEHAGNKTHCCSRENRVQCVEFLQFTYCKTLISRSHLIFAKFANSQKSRN